MSQEKNNNKPRIIASKNYSEEEFKAEILGEEKRRTEFIFSKEKHFIFTKIEEMPFFATLTTNQKWLVQKVAMFPRYFNHYIEENSLYHFFNRIFTLTEKYEQKYKEYCEQGLKDGGVAEELASQEIGKELLGDLYYEETFVPPIPHICEEFEDGYYYAVSISDLEYTNNIKSAKDYVDDISFFRWIADTETSNEVPKRASKDEPF